MAKVNELVKSAEEFHAFQANVNKDIITGTAWYNTYGKMVTFAYGSNVKNIVVGSNIIGNIPEKLRPWSNCYIKPVVSQDMQYQICFRVDGNIELYNYTGEEHQNIHWCRFCAAWIARDS